jgi:hypothetical protein
MHRLHCHTEVEFNLVILFSSQTGSLTRTPELVGAIWRNLLGI